jgi:peptide/nickel transport system substrate-binding protein
MFANFYSKSPLNLANFTDPELDKALESARVTADPAKRTEYYCEAGRIINKNATWFWTFQNTYYAMAKAKVKGVPKLYGGVIDVSTAWLE